MFPVGVNLATALPVSLVFMVSVELSSIITSWRDTFIHFSGMNRNTCIGSKALCCCDQQCCAKACCCKCRSHPQQGNCQWTFFSFIFHASRYEVVVN